MSIPTHIAFIMDGNRRWAKSHSLDILKGHEMASNVVLEKIVSYGAKIGVKYLTFWAFSTENWKRDRVEVAGLLHLFRKALSEKIPNFVKNGVRLFVIGDITKFPLDIQRGIKTAMQKTANGKTITVIIAVNYGGRDEIIRAVNKTLINSNFEIKNFKLEKKDIAGNLDTKGIPDPDLIVRTGGEKRLSGFLLWQSEYCELYFTDVLWPDFGEKDFDLAVSDFQRRSRRFGK